MFALRTPESYLSRSISAEIIAERHARAGDKLMARVWRRYANQFRATATTLAAGGPATEMAVMA